jgi:hypothetical protein
VNDRDQTTAEGLVVERGHWPLPSRAIEPVCPGNRIARAAVFRIGLPDLSRR